MISTNKAKRVYKLNDEDLKDIPFQSFRNPLYKNGARMHLYVEADILEAVERKLVLEAGEAYDRLERRIEKRERKKEEHAARAAKAKTAVESFPPLPSIQLITGKLAIKSEILFKIADGLVDSYEPTGIRGVGILVQDIVSLSRSCKDLFVAADYGLKKLAVRIKETITFPIVSGLADPQTLVSDPMSVTLKPLKEVLKIVGKSTQGTKQGKLLSLSLVILTLQNLCFVSLVRLV